MNPFGMVDVTKELQLWEGDM